MTHYIYLSLGSNLGDRLANLQNALSNLPPQVIIAAQSSVYETEPWGYSDQPLFLNQAIRAETDLEPTDLLVFLKDLEIKMGRKETFRFGPRVIDVDILFYDDLVIETHELVIPHKRIAERAFILVPLAEIAPSLFHPVLKKTIQQLKSEVDASSVQLYQPVN